MDKNGPHVLCELIFVPMTLTMQNSKPIIDFLKELTTAASKFGSLQNKGYLPSKQAEEVSP
jgi:hypothetical protein